MKSTSAIEPLHTMQGHAMRIMGVAHLPGERRTITCSEDGSLRLWDLESGVQIGNDWRDDGKEGMLSIALSPSAKIVANGSSDGTIRLWDIETRKVIARWTGHTDFARSLCWSADGERVVSGSNDGTIRVWDVESGDTVLGPIKTGHKYVSAVMYSPDTTQIATGGNDENALKIWDAKAGNLLSRIKYHYMVWSLTWASDQKKLITGDGTGGIKIFDTATWQQIAILEGDRNTSTVWSLSLFQNDRLLASGSSDSTARLWNLDTNLPVGPRIQHPNTVQHAAISTDGKLLVTGCADNDAYVWDIHAILKDAGLEDLLFIPDMPQDGLKQKATARRSLMDTDAARRRAKHEYTYRLPPRFFDDAPDGVQSSTTTVTHSERQLRSFAPFSPLRANFLPSLFRSPQSNTHQATALQSPPRRSVPSQRTRIVEVATAQDSQSLYVGWRPESSGDKGKEAQQQSESQAHASTSQIAPAVSSVSTRLSPANTTTLAGAVGTQSQSVATSKYPSWWARLVSFVRCAPVPEGR